MTGVAEREMSHEQMGHDGMDSMEHGADANANPNPNALAFDQPTAPCSHCAMHSGNNGNTASQRQSEAATRSGDIGAPVTYSTGTPVIALPIAVLTSRAHGPPGQRVSRHILNNIFRI